MADQTIILEIKTNQKQIDDTKLSILNLKKEVSDFKTESKKQGTAQGEVNKKLVGYQTEIKKTNDKLRELTKQQKLLTNWQNANKGSVDKLRAANVLLTKRLNALNQTTEKGRKRAEAYKKVIDRNTTSINKMTDAATRQRANIGKYNTALKGVGRSLASLATGFIGITTLILAATRAVKEAIEVNREFEKTFVSILGLLNEFDKKKYGEILKQGAIDVMARYGLEIADVNNALFDTISNGIAAGNAIEFLDKSARLAIAGNSDLSSVVKGATKVYAVYKDEVEDVDEILNAFFAAQVKGATTVERLANNIGKIASIAKFAGIPINELFGTFAGLTKFLDGTEESATALTATITALLKVKPGTEQAEAFEKFGIEVGATAIQSNGLLNTLVKVAIAAETNADELSLLIPNIRALKGIAGLTATTIAELEQNIVDLNNAELSAGLVTKAFNEQLTINTKEIQLREGAWKRYILVTNKNEGAIKSLFRTIRREITETLTGQTLEKLFKQFALDTGSGIRGIKDLTLSELESFVIEGEALQKELSEFGAKSSAEGTKRIIDNFKERIDELQKEPAFIKKIEEEKLAELKSSAETEAKIQKIKDDLAAAAFKDKLDKEAKVSDKFNKKVAEDSRKISFKIGEEDADFKDEEFDKDIERAIKLSGELLEIDKDRTDEEIQFEEDKADAISELRQRTIDEAINLGNNLFNFSQSLSGRQSTLLERQFEKDIKAAGDNEKKREDIERKFAIEKAKITRKQAVLDKAQALLNIGINTAMAVTAVASTGGGTRYADFGISAATLSALVVASGLVQAGIVLAKPLPEIPSFSKGTVINKKGEVLKGPSHSGGGIKLYGEGEGGEPILTKSVMSNPMDASVISAINVKHGGIPLYSGHSNYYQDGGVTTQVEAPKIEIVRIPVLILEDVHDLEDTQQQIKVLETL